MQGRRRGSAGGEADQREAEKGGREGAGRTLALGALVQKVGRVLELAVDLDDLASNGRKDVGRSLDRLDGTNLLCGSGRVSSGSLPQRVRVERTSCSNLGALGGELDVDDVAQRLGGVLGDADHARLVVGRQVDPLVVLGVLPYWVYLW